MRKLFWGVGLCGLIACTGNKETQPTTPEPSEPASEPDDTNQPASEPDSSVDTDTSDTSTETGDPPLEEIEYQLLDPVQQLIRISMALRGTRPSLEDIQLVIDNPNAVEQLAENYADSPEFVETMADLYAEALLMRSIQLNLPPLGNIEEEYVRAIHESLAEEPLNIIREVVENNQPFTEVITADWTVLDELGSEIWDNHNYDPTGDDKQVVQYTDARHTAGIISTNGFWTRHTSTGSNYHRGRVNTITKTFLCTDFTSRDIPLSGDIDLSDDEAVAEAVFTQTECVGCHQSLDPLGAHLWGSRPRLAPFQIVRGHDEGCSLLTPCYPIVMYAPPYANGWQNAGLRGPNYFGYEAEDLTDVGAHMAADPRFSQCVSRRMLSYLRQQDLDTPPLEEVVQYQDVFTSSNYSVKDLAVAIVTSPSFLAKSAAPEQYQDEIAGLQIIRPEQIQRMYSELLGFNFEIGIQAGNGINSNYGNFNILKDDVFGFRAMGGGVDGYRITFPTHTPTPIRLLLMSFMADEAAYHIVAHDLSSGETPQLLTDVSLSTTDEVSVRAQLQKLHLQILGENVTTDSAEIDASWGLFSAILSNSDTETAWKTLLSAMLQSPDVLYY